GDMLASVMYCDGVSQEVRDDHRATRPCFDDILTVLLVLTSHLLVEVFVDERTLLEATRHKSVLQSALVAAPAPPHAVRVALPFRPACAPCRRPSRAGWVAAARGPALATAVRVFDRVHRDTAHGRALALPTQAACFAPADVRLLGIADLADGRTAAGIDVADLARRHPQLCETTVLRHELHGRTGGPGDLGAAAGTHLDGVHHGADGDVAQG